MEETKNSFNGGGSVLCSTLYKTLSQHWFNFHVWSHKSLKLSTFCFGWRKNIISIIHSSTSTYHRDTCFSKYVGRYSMPRWRFKSEIFSGHHHQWCLPPSQSQKIFIYCSRIPSPTEKKPGQEVLVRQSLKLGRKSTNYWES